MTRTILPALIAFLSVCVIPISQANGLPSSLKADAAVQILATMDELNPRHYKIIHIADGTLHEKSGFQHNHAKKISYFGPQSRSNTAPSFQHVTMLYSAEYGWYIQRAGRDNRGIFLEISSQKQGRVFVR